MRNLLQFSTTTPTMNSSRKPLRGQEIPAGFLAEDWLGRRPLRNRSTHRSGVVPESRRALCWHRPPVLLPRGATRAKLCKCCQGQTPQNFDRVLAAACLYWAAAGRFWVLARSQSEGTDCPSSHATCSFCDVSGEWGVTPPLLVTPGWLTTCGLARHWVP